MKTLFGLAAVSLLLAAAPANAADLMLRKAPPAAPVWSWSGFYIGANLGGVNESTSGTSDFLDPSALPGDSLTNPQSNSFSSTALIGGGQVGYNWQAGGMWLLGVEGDWDFTHTNYSFCRQTNTNGAACDNSGLDGFESISSNTRWLATARGRLGVTVGNFLFYGTAGVAWGGIETTLSQNCPTGCGSSSLPIALSSTTDTSKVGWVAGVGGEFALQGNWALRLEWLHIDLGTVSNSFSTNGLILGTPSVETTAWSRTERYDVIRAGIDYRLGGP